jgi:hypothetical protein
LHTILAIGDLHCGHLGGLTPPSFWTYKTPDTTKRAWDFFSAALLEVGKVDTLILNGDLIDGQGTRSGGIELIESDLDRQCEMAIEIIESISAKQVLISHGTPYHVSNHGSQEEIKIAKAVGAEVHSHIFKEINGLVFDVRHKINSSSVPHGRATPLCKEAMWNKLKSIDGAQPKADILLRSHVHYHIAVQEPDYLAMTLPALQTPGTKYGLEQCSGIVDFGIVRFNIENDGNYSWDSITTRHI